MNGKPPVLITLGSNIDPRVNLPRAVALLGEAVIVRAVSPVYESAPVAADGSLNPAQSSFLNAAVLAETDLPPLPLKMDVLRGIEARLGRVRTADKFAPRPIDLDLALYGDWVVNDSAAGLILPDPDILTRAHVALPLADLAPDMVHPLTGQTLAAIAARLVGDSPALIARPDILLRA